MNTIKQTAAQTWLSHSLEVLALGAIVTSAINVYTAFGAGNLSLTQAGVIAATAGGAVLSKGLAGLLNNPQTIQATEDTVAELRVAMTTLASSHQSFLAAFTAFLQQQSAASAPAPLQTVPTLDKMATMPQPAVSTAVAATPQIVSPSVPGLDLTGVMKVVGPQQ